MAGHWLWAPWQLSVTWRAGKGVPEHSPKLSGEGEDSKQTFVGADIRDSWFGAS